MTAIFLGKTTSGFTASQEYNIEAMLINSIIYVQEKNKFSNAFCTYYSIEDFLTDWDIKKLN